MSPKPNEQIEQVTWSRRDRQGADCVNCERTYLEFWIDSQCNEKPYKDVKESGMIDSGFLVK